MQLPNNTVASLSDTASILYGSHGDVLMISRGRVYRGRMRSSLPVWAAQDGYPTPIGIHDETLALFTDRRQAKRYLRKVAKVRGMHPRGVALRKG